MKALFNPYGVCIGLFSLLGPCSMVFAITQETTPHRSQSIAEMPIESEVKKGAPVTHSDHVSARPFIGKFDSLEEFDGFEEFDAIERLPLRESAYEHLALNDAVDNTHPRFATTQCSKRSSHQVFSGAISRTLSYDGKAVGVPASLVMQFAHLIDYRSIFQITSLQKGDRFWFDVDGDQLQSALLLRPSQGRGIYALIQTEGPAVFDVDQGQVKRLSGTIQSPVSGGVTKALVRSHFDSVREGGRIHRAVDIDLDKGDPVWAVWPGTVTRVGYDPISGYFIEVEHDEVNAPSLPKKFRTFYAHLNKGSIRVKVGDAVSSKPMAEGGNSGRVYRGKNSDGSHLHLAAYALMPNGKRKPFNLEPYLLVKNLPTPKPSLIAKAQRFHDCLRDGGKAEVHASRQ